MACQVLMTAYALLKYNSYLYYANFGITLQNILQVQSDVFKKL